MFDVIKSMSSQQVPFIQHVGVQIEEVGEGFATTILPDEPHLKNHINTAHAAAIFMVCESASGVATAAGFMPVFLQARPVVREARITYIKAGKGALTATARIDGDVKALLATLEQTGNVDFLVHVEAKSSDSVLVARAEYSWNIKIGQRK
jgi:acyl-coenzyme A thioesterase PaaI-like protein